MAITYQRRHELMQLARDKGATLNGNRATVTGAVAGFATVTDRVTRLSAEWSWEAVERIVTTHGKFVS